MFKTLIATLFLGALLLFPFGASALDQVCDPSDPGYAPFTGTLYVSPNYQVRFCTSLDNPTVNRDIDETQPISCLLEVDGKPYATATDLQPGQEMILFVDDEDRSKVSAASLTCTAFMVATDGSTHERTSEAVTFTFDPIPAPEAPVPLL